MLHIFFQLCMLVFAITEIPQTRAALKNLNDPRGCVVRHSSFVGPPVPPAS